VEILILLVVLVALAKVWSGRNFDAAGLAGKLHKQLAGEFASASDWQDAERHLRAALWLQPGDPETFCDLADAILNDSGLGKNQAREQAVMYYEAALRLKPDFVQARQRLDRTLRELGRQNAVTN
jgi:tetratricopeptide (TPR) repeat protein